MAPPKTLTFITGNQNKVNELQTMLAPFGIRVVKNDCGYPEVQADTVAEVAKAGAEALIQKGIQTPFLLEDSGFVVHALKGFPGPYSSFVQQTVGNQGILSLLQDVEPELRTAHFESCLTYVGPEGGKQFMGTVKGHVAPSAEGNGGFGYDPIFIPKGEQRTFAQMTTEEKNKISHRGRATEAFRQWLANQ